MNSRKTVMGGSRERGFTLIELLVTIAVLTTIISLGVPMYGEFTRSSALTTRSAELISTLNFARSQAVASRRTISIEPIGGDWSNGWEVLDNTLAEPQLRISDFRADIPVQVADETNMVASMSFDREGRVDNATAFVVCVDRNPDSRGRQITVERFGRVRVEGFDCEQ